MHRIGRLYWSISGASWKAVDRPLSSWCSLLLCFSLFFFSHSSSPSCKVLGIQKVGCGHFSQVLIANIHIQSHQSFQKSQGLTASPSFEHSYLLGIVSRHTWFAVCLFHSYSTCKVLRVLESVAFWSCVTQLHRCSSAMLSFWSYYSSFSPSIPAQATHSCSYGKTAGINHFAQIQFSTNV